MHEISLQSVLYVAGREIRVRIRSRLFQIMTTSLLVFAIFPPWLLRGRSEPAADSSIITSHQILTIGLLFTCYGIMVTSASLLSYGIVEEKASRAIDLILTSISPGSFLSGKVLGIATLAAAQTLLLASSALISQLLATHSIIDLSPRLIVFLFCWYVPAIFAFLLLIGYFSYRISKMSDLGIVQLPVLIISALSFFAGVIAVFSRVNTFIAASRYLPFLGSFANPVIQERHDSIWPSDILFFLYLLIIYLFISQLVFTSFRKVAIR